MDLMEAMARRHAVRAYLDRPLAGAELEALEAAVARVNRESGLHIQLVKNEPQAFDSTLAHYGKFSGVANYLALVGPKGPELEERCGYYGEHIVLEAQRLGLNTCWVALTYKKVPSAFTVSPGEKLVMVIAVGYGATQGAAHRSKEESTVSVAEGGAAPEWFRRGVQAALLAPTAMNQQKFRFTLQDGRVTAKAGFGTYTKVDLGIAKYHFELGAAPETVDWA